MKEEKLLKILNEYDYQGMVVSAFENVLSNMEDDLYTEFCVRTSWKEYWQGYFNNIGTVPPENDPKWEEVETAYDNYCEEFEKMCDTKKNDISELKKFLEKLQNKWPDPLPDHLGL